MAVTAATAPVSPVRTDRPELRIDAAAINEGQPVELDGTPTTPSTLRARAEGMPKDVSAGKTAGTIGTEDKEVCETVTKT